MKVLLNDNYDSSDSDGEFSPPWDGRGRLITAPALAGKLSPPAMPVHRAFKEAHLEVLSEVVMPFSLSVWPGLWASQIAHALFLPVRQCIRNGIDSVLITSGARIMLGHETARDGGPDLQV